MTLARSERLAKVWRGGRDSLCLAEAEGFSGLTESGSPTQDRAKRGIVAGWTGLEPAASGVTGRRSNQLNYDPD